MLHLTDEGLRLICHFEGFSSVPYRCPGGYLTVGYGHVIRAEEVDAYADGISKPDALALLRADVRNAGAAVKRLIHVPLTDGQADALISFTFNLGAGALERSTLRRVIHREAHSRVPAELLRWVWADGKRLRGLIRRRQAEAQHYQGIAWDI